MRTLEWLKSLPECEYAVSRPAGLWLLGAALLVWPIDIAVTKYGERQWETITYIDNGVSHQTLARPLWVGLSRLGLGFFVITFLIVCGPVAPRDLGLTFGKPKVTLFWIGFPIAAMVSMALIVLVGACLLVRVTAWPVHPDWLMPSYVFTPDATWRVVWEVCAIAPLVEEILYRGVPLLALERLCGRGWAVVLGGVIWTFLHLIYGHPLARAPVYFLFTGALFAWIFLKCRSLLTMVLLHAICNLAIPVGFDLVLLYQSDTIARLLGQG
jgi:membrane protease YdiL (CAAX protease family)